MSGELQTGEARANGHLRGNIKFEQPPERDGGQASYTERWGVWGRFTFCTAPRPDDDTFIMMRGMVMMMIMT